MRLSEPVTVQQSDQFLPRKIMMKQQMIDNSAKIVSPDTVTTSTRYCHKFAEFMKTRPPTFAGSATSWYTDQWLGTIENKLDMVQCDEKNKVFYAAHQLQGAALECWKGYCATDKDPQAISWAEFSSILHYMDVSPGFIKTKDHTKDGVCTLCSQGYRYELMWCPRNKPRNCACARCGEIGHSASEHEISCSSCEQSHLLGECPMSKLTCYLCEGDDHVPIKCPLSSILTTVTQHQREAYQEVIQQVIGETNKIIVTPVKKFREVDDSSLQYQCKRGSESASKVACSACGEQGEAASYKAKCMSKTRKASSKTKNVVCFSCNEMGHFANRCPLRHQTPAQDKTIPKAILTKRTTPTTGGEGKKRRKL